MKFSHAIISLPGLTSQAFPACECGFAVNGTNSLHFGLFTDFFETDFLHASNVTNTSIGNSGWQPQVFNTSAKESNGDYGTSKQLGNIIANPLPEGQWGGSPVTVGEAGLQLWVRHDLENGLIPVAEISSPRDDMLYGSFRAAIKFSGMNGTCGAFFWYHNDTQEIDIEFLSKQHTVLDLTVHTPEPAEDDDSSDSGESSIRPNSTHYFSVINFPDEYHEYRFDWLPDRVDYYINGDHVKTFTGEVPNTPGHLMLGHWSNGNPDWSAGPPLQDAVMTVGYVKAYFNVTTRDEPRVGCHDLSVTDAVCVIPPQNRPPISDGKRTHFYSLPAKGEAPEHNDFPKPPSMHNEAAIVGVGRGSIWVVIVYLLARRVMRRE